VCVCMRVYVRAHVWRGTKTAVTLDLTMLNYDHAISAIHHAESQFAELNCRAKNTLY